MILLDQVNLGTIAFLRHQAGEELVTQDRVVKARALLDGYDDNTLARETAISWWAARPPTSMDPISAKSLCAPSCAGYTLRTTLATARS